jgi:hypothetical protein
MIVLRATRTSGPPVLFLDAVSDKYNVMEREQGRTVDRPALFCIAGWGQTLVKGKHPRGLTVPASFASLNSGLFSSACVIGKLVSAP